MNYVVDSYENYKEENRLTTNNARRIEFVTTTRVLDEIIGTKSKILDCAAGTGTYAFWLADKGHDVTATDITPGHIDIINRTLTNKNYHMNTSALDATDMSCFADDSFDIVFNMGPFYHLITEKQREKCMKECLRVLRKGGLLVTAYIPRYYVFQYIATYFNYLLQNYLSAERFERAAFERRTGVGKNVYYKLSGISKETKDKPVKADTLFDVAIGLRLTYEEALVLFTLWGKNLLCDDSVLQKMNEELLELDS